jgi:GNAT superfamily N-acetyltransferase
METDREIMQMHIRPLKTTEFETVCNIYDRSRGNVDCFADESISLQEMIRLTQGEEIAVAALDDQDGCTLTGFISIWSPEKFVHHLYVDPKYQGRGVATKLIAYAKKIHGMPLRLKCLVANESACRFYEASGWETVQCSKGPEGGVILYHLTER